MCSSASHILYLAPSQIPAEISLTVAGQGKSKVASFGKREMQRYRVIVPQQIVPKQASIISTQTLTMYFDAEHLRGVVWCSHIFSVGHTAKGPFKEPSHPHRDVCTLCSVPGINVIGAPNSPLLGIYNAIPGLHVLGKGKEMTGIDH